MDAKAADLLRAEIESEFARSARGETCTTFPALPEIPTARYADAEFAALEQQYLWPKTWLIAGHVDELPDIGSYKLWTDSGVPVILVRDKDRNINAFYNVCRHRGGPLVMQPSGTLTTFSCKMHGWTYDLRGALKFVTDEHEFPGLDKSVRNLPPLRCELWGHFIFVNRDNHAPPLREWLGHFTKEFKDYDFENRHVFATVEYEMDCDWKIGIESNAEIYHFPVVHKGTVDEVFDHRGGVIDLYAHGHSRMIVPYRKEFSKLAAEMFNVRARAPTQMLTKEAIPNYLIFPNLLCSANEFQFPLITYWPQGNGKTKMLLYYTSPFADEDPESAESREVINAFTVALEEDRAPLCALQQAYASGLIATARVSTAERRLYHLQEHIDNVIGSNNIPPRFRVPPMTEPHIEAHRLPEETR